MIAGTSPRHSSPSSVLSYLGPTSRSLEMGSGELRWGTGPTYEAQHAPAWAGSAVTGLALGGRSRRASEEALTSLALGIGDVPHGEALVVNMGGRRFVHPRACTRAGAMSRWWKKRQSGDAVLRRRDEEPPDLGGSERGRPIPDDERGLELLHGGGRSLRRSGGVWVAEELRGGQTARWSMGSKQQRAAGAATPTGCGAAGVGEEQRHDPRRRYGKAAGEPRDPCG